MTVRDIDRGWDRIKREVKKLDGAYTKIGLPENAQVGQPQSIGSGHPPADQMSDLVVIGAVHEYGSKIVPERSFLRSTTDEQRVKIARLQDKALDKMYLGEINAKTAIGLLGEFMTTKVKQKIVALKFPPLAAITKKRKGSTNPLIDTGQMLQSIQHIEVMK
ncbi:MAG: hypothetical protein KAU20_02505 [Nanoarchaeota archaeon]|nr:hypothetical protein [Nanoarchaeota archaeon]